MLLVHGAGGNYIAPYMQRMCRRLYRQGYLVLRLNLRACGPSLGLSKTPYHGGQSEDTRHVIQWAARQFPNSPLTQIGFSLGGNITLKMAGEDGSRPAGNLDSVVAVSPPVNISAAMDKLSLPQNRILEKSFASWLIKQTQDHHKYFPEFKPYDLPPSFSIKEFHEMYTAPIGGFRDAADYYEKNSAMKYVPEIKVPSLILCAMDDPVVDGHFVAKIPHGKDLDIILTEHGGHVGFLGWGTTWDEVRWCDQAVAKWLEANFAA
jgi:predicted alpha/beta-fold hydrolase